MKFAAAGRAAGRAGHARPARRRTQGGRVLRRAGGLPPRLSWRACPSSRGSKDASRCPRKSPTRAAPRRACATRRRPRPSRSPCPRPRAARDQRIGTAAGSGGRRLRLRAGPARRPDPRRQYLPDGRRVLPGRTAAGVHALRAADGADRRRADRRPGRERHAQPRLPAVAGLCAGHGRDLHRLPAWRWPPPASRPRHCSSNRGSSCCLRRCLLQWRYQCSVSSPCRCRRPSRRGWQRCPTSRRPAATPAWW